MLKILFTLSLILSPAVFAGNKIVEVPASSCSELLSLQDQERLVGLVNDRFKKIGNSDIPRFYEVKKVEPLSYANSIGSRRA